MQRRNLFLMSVVKNVVTALFCFFLLLAGLALAQDPDRQGSQPPTTPSGTPPAPTQPPLPAQLPPMPHDTVIPGDTSHTPRILTPLDLEKKDTTQSNQPIGQTHTPKGGKTVMINTAGTAKSLIYVVDGKISTEEKVGALEEKDVKRVKFVKDPEVIAQFGGKTAKGMIVVTTRLKN